MEEIKQASKRLKTAREKVDEEYHQFVNQLDIEEERIEKRYQALADKQKSYAESHGNSNASADDIIEIDAGGKIITAKRGTLCQIEGTILSALFSGSWDRKLQRDNDGRIFLDVNSEAFQSIVDYLNELAISPPDNLPKTPTSRDGENQLNLDHLLELFLRVQRSLIDSTIVKDVNQISQLHEWLGEGESDGDFRLLYRSSRDGSTGFDFHSRCDNKGSTITIIETVGGLVLGGFSSTPWSSCLQYTNESYLRSGKAFLFTLLGADITPPCKMKLKHPNSKLATYHYHEYGPSFGEDFKVLESDLHLCPMRPNAPYDMSPLMSMTLGIPGLQRVYAIREVEVFRVHGSSTSTTLAAKRASSFSCSINNALNEKIETLKKAEQQVVCMEKRFDEEVSFINTFASGDTKDVVKLNVSGTILATKRSTLLVFEESVLAQQFDNSKWTEQGNGSHRVKNWTPDDVFFWAQNIDDIPDDIATMFVDNSITGNELLAMTMEGLKMIGIKRAGTLCLLLKEIAKLEKATEDIASALIEHSPYCFKVILDYLRMKQLHTQDLADAPDLPTVRDSERDRFGKVVEYYFPGDSAMLLLGMPMPITIKMALSASVDPNSSGDTKDSLKDGRLLDTVTLVVAIRHNLINFVGKYVDVEDGTGHIQIAPKSNNDDDDDDDDGIHLREVCKENTYVRIIGQVEDFGGHRHIIASDVRPLSSGNDITNHFLEVAQAYDKYLSTKQQVEARGEKKRSRERVSYPPVLLDAVLGSIQVLGDTSDSGAHVPIVVRDVSRQGFSAPDIRAAITHLSSEGLIYSTIDWDHYQFAE